MSRSESDPRLSGPGIGDATASEAAVRDAGAPPPPRPDLRARAISAFKWSAAGKFLGQMISWGATLYVMRKLEPAHYGLMGMATVAISFLGLVNELGLGAALVQRRHIDERTKRQVFGLVLMMNVALFTLLYASATWIAAYYGEPQVAPVVRALAYQFLLVSFVVVPQSMLERDLDFKHQSIVFLIASLAGSVTQVVLVHMDMGVWCLVWANLVLVGVRAIGLNIIRPFLKLPLLAFRGAGELVSYGGIITGSRVVWSLYQRSDVIIGGRLLGTTLIGLYDAAMHYATLPMQKMGMIINQVTFPVFASIQGHRELVRGHLLKAIHLLAAFSFPVLWGIAAVSRESVMLLLGTKWEGVIVPLQILSLVAPLRMINGLNPPVYQGIGRPSYELFDLLRSAVVMIPAFWIGCKWGILGLSLAWALAHPCVTLMNMCINYPRIGIRVRDALSALRTPFVAAALMFGAVALARQLAPGGTPSAVLLPLLIAVGGITYPLVLFRLEPGLRGELRALLRH